MRQQVQPHRLASGQRLHQRQRIGDRARAHRRVVEPEDALAVAREEFAHARRVLGPQLRERAGGVDESAVHEHEHRAGGRRGCGQRRDALPAALELVECRGVERVEARFDLAVDLLQHLLGDPAGRLALQAAADTAAAAGEDLDRAQHHVAHPAARRRGALEPVPAQLGADDDLARCAGAGGTRRAGAAGAPCTGSRGRSGAAQVARRSLREQQVARRFRMQPQHRATGDVQRHHVAAGHRFQPLQFAAATLRRQAHAAAQRAGRRCLRGAAGTTRPRRGGAVERCRAELPRHEEDDRTRVRGGGPGVAVRRRLPVLPRRHGVPFLLLPSEHFSLQRCPTFVMRVSIRPKYTADKPASDPA
ncbi:MAG: hypothetical protein U1F49_01410 [Rubrivivax sp.]